jgi:pimeloyl-ACP methyl ester carboxylesterase
MKRLLIVLLALALAPPLSAQNTSSPEFSVKRAGVPGGTPMILIPGLLSSGDVWSGTVEHFKSKYDIHVLTLAGFAGVPAIDADPFLKTERDAIVRYIQVNHLDHPIIVGHSLGGFLALWIASTAPDLVGKVIAVDGVPYLAALRDTSMTPSKAMPQATMMRNGFASMNTEALGAQTRMAMTMQVRDSVWYTRGAAWGTSSDAKTAGKAVAEMMTTDIRGDVARIKTPVLMFMSGFGMTPEQRTFALGSYRAQLAPVANARVIPVENSRHFIMLDEPAFFYNAVTDFLKSK